MSTRIRILVFAALVALQAVTVVAIVATDQLANRDVLISQMDRMLAEVADASAARTEQFLAPAGDTVAVTATLLGDGVLSVERPEELATTLRAQLRATPQITSIAVGTPDGTLVQAREDPEIPGGTRTRIIRDDGTTRQVEIVVFEPGGAELARFPDNGDPYDPRLRPWFTLGASSTTTQWTDPYRFSVGNEAGITATRAVQGDTGELAAVVGVDIRLSALDELMSRLEVGQEGAAFVLDTEGRAIASVMPPGQTREAEVAEADPTDEADPTGEAELSHDALTPDDPLLGTLTASFGSEDAPGAGSSLTTSFTYGDEPWRARALPLAERDDWYVAVAAPEDDFVGAVRDAQREQALLAVAIGLGVVLAAVPLVLVGVRAVSRLHERATLDPLTRLANRRAFDEHLAELADEARRQGRPLCAALVDLDLFKDVNDTHGHATGDAVLRHVAERLRHNVRDDDLVARIGGDELAVLLPDTGLADAAAVLERVRMAVADTPVNGPRGPVPITVTVGIGGPLGVGPADGQARTATGAQLIEAADRALYRAKAAGRNRVASGPLGADPGPDPTTPPSGPSTSGGPGEPVGGVAGRGVGRGVGGGVGGALRR